MTYIRVHTYIVLTLAQSDLQSDIYHVFCRLAQLPTGHFVLFIFTSFIHLRVAHYLYYVTLLWSSTHRINSISAMLPGARLPALFPSLCVFRFRFIFCRSLGSCILIKMKPRTKIHLARSRSPTVSEEYLLKCSRRSQMNSSRMHTTGIDYWEARRWISSRAHPREQCDERDQLGAMHPFLRRRFQYLIYVYLHFQCLTEKKNIGRV